MFSIASSVIRVRFEILNGPVDNKRDKSDSLFFVVVEVGKGFGASSWKSGLTEAGNAASVRKK